MVTRWSPFNEALSLRDAMNQLFETSFVRPSYFAAGTSGWQGFPMNIYEREDNLIVEALLPGISPEDVQVSVDQGMLTIGATRHSWQPEEGKEQKQSWYLHEIVPGQFKRSLSLPFPVDADQAQATYVNGVLTLTLPKSEAARPKRIQVQTGSQQQITAGKS
jgi:HSP20 family protein